jgi:hypothetical protein
MLPGTIPWAEVTIMVGSGPRNALRHIEKRSQAKVRLALIFCQDEPLVSLRISRVVAVHALDGDK